MNRPEQQQIDHWLQNAQDGIDRAWRLNREGFHDKNGVSLQTVYLVVALNHASLARARFLNGDPLDEARAEFAKAARCILKSFTMAYDEQDPDYQGKRADLSCNSETIMIRGLNHALMAADFGLARELAGWFRDPGDGVCMDDEVNRHVHAFKHTLLGAWGPARKLLTTQENAYLSSPSKRNDYRKNYYAMSTALLGILKQDDTLFNKGLRMHLEIYQGYAQGEAKDTTQEFVCDYAVALANLGLHHGLAVTVEHDTLPPGLLIRT